MGPQKRTSIMSLLMAFVLGIGSMTVLAQTPEVGSPPMANRAISFYPEETGAGTYITVTVEPGASKTVNVILGNSGDIEQTIRTYAAPATSAVNGGFIMEEFGTEPDMVTQWIDYPDAVYTFAPTEGQNIPVMISVPDDAAPGEYVTGLAAEQAEAFEVPGTEMIVQRVRWVIPVLVVVPGERAPSFDLGDATIEHRGTAHIAVIGIENTGNVIVRPEGEVRLLDADGTVLGVAQVRIDSIYPGSNTTFIVAWDNLPLSEMYSLQIKLTAEEGTVVVEKQIDKVVPFSEDGSLVATPGQELAVSRAELTPATDDMPPSLLMFDGEITNSGDAIENARVSIVTYKDGEEVDRYPIMQAVTIQTGTTPVEARYSLPGGFTQGIYTFEVTIETGDAGTQSVLATHPIDYELVVP